jgi:hypothetical protein
MIDRGIMQDQQVLAMVTQKIVRVFAMGPPVAMGTEIFFYGLYSATVLICRSSQNQNIINKNILPIFFLFVLAYPTHLMVQYGVRNEILNGSDSRHPFFR